MDQPNIDELNRALKLINDGATASKDFVWEQAPLVVKEAVYWVIGSSLIDLALSLALLVSMLILIRKYLRALYIRAKAIDDNHDYDPPIAHVGLGVLCIACLMFVSTQLCRLVESSKSVVKGLVAPRILVIDYLSAKLNPEDCKK